MLRHVVLLRFTDETTAQHVRAITDALRDLAVRLPAVRDYKIGTDLGLVDENSHFAIVADFDDLTGFVTYRDDPEHHRIIAELVRPHVAGRAAAQYEL